MAGSGHGGRPGSWVAVSVIFIGFLIGGLAIPLESWILFWVGVGVLVVGTVVAFVVDIMSDVVVDQPYESAHK